MVKQTRTQFYEYQFELNRNNIKGQWLIIYEATGKYMKKKYDLVIKDDGGTSQDDPFLVASAFNNFFTSIPLKLCAETLNRMI